MIWEGVTFDRPSYGNYAPIVLREAPTGEEGRGGVTPWCRTREKIFTTDKDSYRFKRFLQKIFKKDSHRFKRFLQIFYGA